MNPRWELFRAGAPFYVGHTPLRRGHRVPVFDHAAKARRAARNLAAAGLDDAAIAVCLGRSQTFVRLARCSLFSALIRLSR